MKSCAMTAAAINFCLDLIGLGLVEFSTDFHPKPERYVLLHWSHGFPGNLVLAILDLAKQIRLWRRRPKIDHCLFDLTLPVILHVCLDSSLFLRRSGGEVQACPRTLTLYTILRASTIMHPTVDLLSMVVINRSTEPSAQKHVRVLPFPEPWPLQLQRCPLL